VVVAVPALFVIQRDEEQVGPLEVVQHLLALARISAAIGGKQRVQSTLPNPWIRRAEAEAMA
jgi:hypothetical protein